jgi:hypothetical protein
MELGRSERTSHGVEPTPLIESRVDWMLDALARAWRQVAPGGNAFTC